LKAKRGVFKSNPETGKKNMERDGVERKNPTKKRGGKPGL